VHFENPVSFVDAVLAADKQLDQPLTKEVWDKVRDDQGLVESFENITQKGGHLGYLLKNTPPDDKDDEDDKGKAISPDFIEEDIVEKGTFHVYCY
jgi:hypothetical protein